MLRRIRELSDPCQRIAAEILNLKAGIAGERMENIM